MVRRVLRAVCGTATAAAAVASLVLFSGAAPGASASTSSGLRLGLAPTIPAGARALGLLPGSASLHVTVTLNPRDPAALAAYATDAGAVASYSAGGLPRGLTIDHASGRISSRPSAIGTFSVRAVATDSQGAEGSVAFLWTIGGPPSVSQGSLSGAAGGRSSLSFTVRAGRDALPLGGVSIRPPAGLGFTPARNTIVVLGADGRRLRFTDSTRRGVLTIKLRAAASQVRSSSATPSSVSRRHFRSEPAAIASGR